MIREEMGAQLSEKGPTMVKDSRQDYVIEWKKITTVFSRVLLVATLVYSYADAGGQIRKAAVVLGKVSEECLEDPFSRFVFWLTADSNLENIRFGAETRREIRMELAKAVTPPTELQIKDMNRRMNSLPDYLRVFYLEDYFDSVMKRRQEGR